jgi:hypothetical protein
VAEIKHLSTGELRRLHPTELLAAFSFSQHELPQLMGSLGSQYAAEAAIAFANATIGIVSRAARISAA